MESELVETLTNCLSVLFIWEQRFGKGVSVLQAYSPVKVQLAIHTIQTAFLSKPGGVKSSITDCDRKAE